jgi:phospholipid/cholesterol/gamma-HCH transport system permease protein
MSVKPDTTIEITADDAATRLVLRGAFTITNVSELERSLNDIAATSPVEADLSGVARIDTSGAWALSTLRDRIQKADQSFRISGASKQVDSLLATVTSAMPHPKDETDKRTTLTDRVVAVGRSVTQAVTFLSALTSFFGLFLARLARAVRHPSEFRLTALVHHCEDVGVRAVPIVALMSFLIGVVLAFQGATQLQQFGAEVFVVDLLAISILRELGILLTSIIVAGRTASAFTAAIGSMKMREEIDAMRTLGLDPAMMLFVPRILALILMLPILGLVADVMGLLGGGLMAWVDLGISPAMFVTRLVEGTDVDHVLVGMIKAPVFAIIIGVVGCHAGMQVQSNAESLGRMTSSAVVTAIFAVIVADAIFSIFFAQIGI